MTFLRLFPAFEAILAARVLFLNSAAKIYLFGDITKVFWETLVDLDFTSTFSLLIYRISAIHDKQRLSDGFFPTLLTPTPTHLFFYRYISSV